jgi:hypothetical protein
MENLTLEDISIGMHFKSLNPIKRDDGIEFPKGSYFRVTEVVYNGAYEDEKRYQVTLQCSQEGPQRMALPVQTPKHREQSGHMRELGVTLARLNEQFEKLDDVE